MTQKTPDFQALVGRLEKVERQNQGLKRAVAALAVLGVAVLVIGAAQPKIRTVEAEAFILRDADGQQRAKLVAPSGYPGFILYDQNGTPRMRLSVVEGPSISLYDRNGNLRSKLWLQDDEPILFFYDSDDRNQLGIGVTKEGPGLFLFDENGIARIGLAVAEKPGLAFLRDDGKTVSYSIP